MFWFTVVIVTVGTIIIGICAYLTYLTLQKIDNNKLNKLK